MTPQELLKAGRLDEAVAAQVALVKAKPTDPDQRVLLFTLLCLAGDLERAEKHLDAATASGDEKLTMGATVYQGLLLADYERRKVYREGARPVLPPDAPATLELRLEALGALRAGDAVAAERLLDQAAEQAVALSGKLAGEAFDGLRDDDDVLGQVLEVYAGGRCLWLPMESVRKLEISEPGTQLDLLWVSAELEDRDGEHASVYLPVLYEGSHEHPNDAVRLGRATEWIDCGAGICRGAGQKVLFTVSGDEERETGLLSARTLEIEGSPADAVRG